VKYKTYQSYKDSGVEWLGGVPEHWETNRLKFLTSITTGNKDTENKVDDGDYPFYVRSQTVERINSYSFNGEGILTAGDGVGVGKVFHYADGKFDYHQRVYLFYAFRKVIGRFLFEYIKNNFYKVALAGVAKSTVDSLRLPLIQNFVITVPPLREQQSIATYIDKATAKIDTTIAKQTQLIELLKEKRQALISTSVTRGLDNTVAMKDSGVEWLGEIPEHWFLSKLRFQINGIKDGTHGSHKNVESGRILLSGKNVQNGKLLIAANERIISEEAHQSIVSNGFPQKGDILFVSIGATLGKVCVYPNDKPIAFQRSVCFVRPKKNMLPELLYYILRSHSAQSQLKVLTNQATISGVYMGDLVEIIVPVVPFYEQEEIVFYITNSLLKYQTLIYKATKSIALLKEKRTALISSAVTGKIDVREAV